MTATAELNRPVKGAPVSTGKGNNGHIDPAILDLVHLSRFTLGDAQFEMELLGLFQIQAADQQRALASAAHEQDWLVAAHTLKGTAMSVGAKRVAQTAAALEKLGFAGARDDRARLLGQLAGEVAECAKAINTLK